MSARAKSGVVIGSPCFPELAPLANGVALHKLCAYARWGWLWLRHEL